MAAPHPRTKLKRLSRKGRVPICIEIEPELKAFLAQRAKQKGMSLTAYTSFLMELALEQGKIETESSDTTVEQIVEEEIN